MNVRKPVDYGTMYRELTASLTQNLLQMDEVYAIGKAISQRPEKGAAVAAAEFLQANFPDRTGDENRLDAECGHYGVRTDKRTADILSAKDCRRKTLEKETF